MANGETVPPPEAAPPGQQIATSLIENLVIANENAKDTRELLAAILVELETFNDNMCAVGNAFDELAEISQEKGKLSMSDVAQSFARAFAEMADEEEPEETSPGAGVD